MKFCSKKILLVRLFPTITGHGAENVLPMKFEILGLATSSAQNFYCLTDSVEEIHLSVFKAENK